VQEPQPSAPPGRVAHHRGAAVRAQELEPAAQAPEARAHADADQRERFITEVTPLKPQLLAFCRHVTWTRDDQEDVLQSALSTAFATFAVFRPGTNFRAWMFRHVQNAAYQHNRRRRPEPLSDDVAAPQGDAADSTMSQDVTAARQAVIDDPAALIDGFETRVRTAMLGLSEAERTSLLLRSVADCTYLEIADIMGMPSGTVMSHLARARAKMRARLAMGRKE
jgi:RNA polymerase sigma-70 factor (ECF subfamily)